MSIKMLVKVLKGNIYLNIFFKQFFTIVFVVSVCNNLRKLFVKFKRCSSNNQFLISLSSRNDFHNLRERGQCKMDARDFYSKSVPELNITDCVNCRMNSLKLHTFWS